VIVVIVIEVGFCLVVQLKTEEIDGYEVVQFAFEEILECKVMKVRIGYLKKIEMVLYCYLVEFSGMSEVVFGELVIVEVFELGDKIKVIGILIGKGFVGIIKCYNFQWGSKSYGLYNICKSGLIGFLVMFLWVFKGMCMVGCFGGKWKI